jgi:hypothetical protein
MGTDILETHSAAGTSVSVPVATTEYARIPETASIPLSEPDKFLGISCLSHKILVGKPEETRPLEGQVNVVG